MKIEIDNKRLVLVPVTSDEEKHLRALAALRCNVAIHPSPSVLAATQSHPSDQSHSKAMTG